MSPEGRPLVVVVDGQLHPNHDFAGERARWQRSGFEVRLGECRNRKDLVEAAHDADVVAFWGLDVPFDREVITQLSRCRLIVRYGVGVDSVDVEAATDMGILVAVPAGFCTVEVAEHASALLLTLNRRIPFLDRHIRAGGWRQAGPLTSGVHRLSEQTLGLIGFGRIAQRVAANLQPMVGRTLAHDPVIDDTVAQRSGVELVTLDLLLRESDLISIHVPLTAETRHLLGPSEFEKLKPTSFLVNTSRGAIVDEEALVAALETGRLAGAGLDVFDTEPLADDSPLRRLESVVVTPHSAATSEEAKSDLYERVAGIVEDVLEGHLPDGVVNHDAVRAPTTERPEPGGPR